jgi:hypothetical protein
MHEEEEDEEEKRTPRIYTEEIDVRLHHEFLYLLFDLHSNKER